MTDRKLRVAAYARVSTDQDDQANSLISQRRYFADYITRHENWILDDVYFDEGISGTQTGKRFGFNAMIDRAMGGEIDLILTKEVCRFARNTVDALLYTRKLKERGIGVIFTIDHIDTRDSDGELRLTIMASIAQEESRKTSERVKWGQKRRMEQGVVFGRNLLGYTVQGGRLAVREEEAPIVRAIFHKYTNEGKGLRRIARELESEGMRPMYAGQWSDAVIRKILRNEKYVGDLCQKKTVTPDYLTHAKKRNTGSEEMVILRDHHEPLIDRELWNRTQEELRRRSKKVGFDGEERVAKYSNRYWCSGKIRCGLCGRSFVSRTRRRKDGSVYQTWRCYGAVCGGSGRRGCTNGSVKDRELLACMRYCVRLLPIALPELKGEILREIERAKAPDRGERDLRCLEGKIEAIAEKKRRAFDLLLEGVMTKAELAEQTKWYDGQIGRLTGALADLREGREREARELAEKENESLRTALDGIFSLDENVRILYRELLDRITVYPDKAVEIRLKGMREGVRVNVDTGLNNPPQ